MRARIVDNPYSFRGPYPVHRVLPIFAEAGWDVDVVHNAPGASARGLVRRAIEDGCEVVIGAGGDGTLRDIATVLASTNVGLGVLPGGTANVFAHDVGIPVVPERAARALVEGIPRRIDLGRIELPDGRWTRFLLTAGLGLDGSIMARTDPRLKRRTGPGAIGFAALGAIPGFRPRLAEITVDGRVAWSGPALQLLVSNTRLYANIIQPTPSALLDDGMLDVLVIPRSGWASVGRVTGTFVRTGRPHATLTVAARGAEVVVRSWARIPIQLDGSPLGWKPSPGGAVRIDSNGRNALPNGRDAPLPGRADRRDSESAEFRFRAEPAALLAWLPADVPDGFFRPVLADMTEAVER